MCACACVVPPCVWGCVRGVGGAMCCSPSGRAVGRGKARPCTRSLWTLRRVHVVGEKGRAVGGQVWRHVGSRRVCACVLRVARGAAGWCGRRAVCPWWSGAVGVGLVRPCRWSTGMPRRVHGAGGRGCAVCGRRVRDAVARRT